ncbi:hypothetical protein [Verminephrobacter aporrectodeae]|uniref:hypothetical protein n=1 Tax=Verminephrobacter aporrectodeae TaxID=1110389 RepID=UPI002237AF12|nr:hypothetical protein [Verminephrobacter aporrectodeae]
MTELRLTEELAKADDATSQSQCKSHFCSYVQKSIFCALMIFPENAFHSPETPRCSPQSAKDEHTLTI